VQIVAEGATLGQAREAVVELPDVGLQRDRCGRTGYSAGHGGTSLPYRRTSHASPNKLPNITGRSPPRVSVIPLLRFLSQQRQPDREGAALPLGRDDRDGAPVRDHQFVGDEEAQAQAPPRLLIVARCLVEAREEIREI